MLELWEVIEGYEKYSVSNYGVVINNGTGKQLKPFENKGGYLQVNLCVDGECTAQYVHYLVVRSFVIDYREGLHIRHRDQDKTNNRLTNLWLLHRTRGELYKNHEPWGRRVRIVETDEVFRTVRDVAHFIGGDYGNVYQVLRGQRKQHMGYTFEWYDPI